MLRIALVFLACGCSSVQPDTSYSGSARHRYLQGEEALNDSEYLEAVKHFTYVKNKFAYSKYAALSELRLADTYFEQDKYIEAIDGYRTFVRVRPNHRKVPYALWRIGVCNFEQIPSDFFLFPPAHEKDQASTKDALRAFQRYVDRFPDHEHVPEAKDRILECRRSLVDYELYVARFYLRQERPDSARGRLVEVHTRFGDVADRWAAGSWLLAELLWGKGEHEEAVKVARAGLPPTIIDGPWRAPSSPPVLRTPHVALRHLRRRAALFLTAPHRRYMSRG